MTQFCVLLIAFALYAQAFISVHYDGITVQAIGLAILSFIMVLLTMIFWKRLSSIKPG